MNGPPRKQVMEQLDALRREIAEYHRWLAEFPAVCRVLENIMLRVEQPLPGTELARYRSISNLRDELRAMRAAGVMACRKCGGAMKLGKAMGQTLDCSDEGTCSPAGPGKLIDCMKCEACGWSVTAGVRTPDGGQHGKPAPLTQEEAQVLAAKVCTEYLTACCIAAGPNEREHIGNYLMKLASVAGVVMAQAEGSEVAFDRLIGTAQFILNNMPRKPSRLERLQ